MPSSSSRIVRTLDDLDAAWLADALQSGPVASFTHEPIGTGQMSESHRISLTYADPEPTGPATIVVKLAASDAASRSTGVGLGIYAREIRFYEQLAPRIGGPLAACRLARFDESDGWFTLLLEDVAPAEQGDQIAGCSLAQARLAVRSAGEPEAADGRRLADRRLGRGDDRRRVLHRQRPPHRRPPRARARAVRRVLRCAAQARGRRDRLGGIAGWSTDS